MDLLLILGLMLSLFGAFAFFFIFKKKEVNSLKYYHLISRWILGLFVFILAYIGTDLWSEQLGLTPLSWSAFFMSFVATTVLFVSWPLLQYVQQIFGGISTEQSKAFARITNTPLNYRVFLVVTAAVTEEVLYRGYAIGVGQHILGNIWIASIVSIVAFTLAHIHWGLSHLLTVFWAALVFSCLFIYTQSLWACIFAHICIDVVGFILVPAIKAHKSKRVSSKIKAG